MMWSYGWNFPNTGGIGFLGTPLRAGISQDTAFWASDVYRLTLSTTTSANRDSQQIRLSVGGLVAVPEPSTVLLLGLGFAALWLHRRHPLGA